MPDQNKSTLGEPGCVQQAAAELGTLLLFLAAPLFPVGINLHRKHKTDREGFKMQKNLEKKITKGSFNTYLNTRNDLSYYILQHFLPTNSDSEHRLTKGEKKKVTEEYSVNQFLMYHFIKVTNKSDAQEIATIINPVQNMAI